MCDVVVLKRIDRMGSEGRIEKEQEKESKAAKILVMIGLPRSEVTSNTSLSYNTIFNGNNFAPLMETNALAPGLV